MYLFNVCIKDSSIQGRGVFTEEPISKGSVVWKFDPIHDVTISPEQYDKLNEQEKADIRKVGYVSPASHYWVYPPENDPARFTNHSDSLNNLSAVFDETVSSEPFFIAKTDIQAGDELTVNYSEFDDSIKQDKPEWMKNTAD